MQTAIIGCINVVKHKPLSRVLMYILLGKAKGNPVCTRVIQAICRATFSLLMQVLYLVVGVLIMTFDLLTCVHSQGMVY